MPSFSKINEEKKEKESKTMRNKDHERNGDRYGRRERTKMGSGKKVGDKRPMEVKKDI